MRIRRYEILQDTRTVKERVLYALGEEALISLNIRLSEPYEGEPPIPPGVELNNITLNILQVARSKPGSPLRAYGLTAENTGASIIIPSDEDTRSTLTLLDAKNHRSSHRHLKANH